MVLLWKVAPDLVIVMVLIWKAAPDLVIAMVLIWKVLRVPVSILNRYSVTRPASRVWYLYPATVG